MDAAVGSSPALPVVPEGPRTRSGRLWWQIGAAVGLGVVLGAMVLLRLPEWVYLILGAVTAGLFVVWRPGVAIVGFVALTSTLFSSDALPGFWVGVGTLYITDVILGLLFMVIGLRWLRGQDMRTLRTPMSWPLLLFCGFALVGTVRAVLASTLHYRDSLDEVRTLNSYLLFFPVIFLIRQPKQVRRLVDALLFLATIVAVAMAAQFVLGTDLPIIPGRVEVLRTEGSWFGSVTRVIPPGASLLLYSYIILGAILTHERVSLAAIVRFVQWNLIAMGLVLTFYRAFWVIVMLAFVMMLWLVRGRARGKLILWFALLGIVGAIVLGVGVARDVDAMLRLVTAGFDRFYSLVESGTYLDQQSSLRWRDFEYVYAARQIAAHPLLGIGLGARYRPDVPGKDHPAFDGRAYIHNGHLWILTKAGLLSYLCFLWLAVTALSRGISHWRDIVDPYARGVLLGTTLAFAAALVGALVESYLMIWYWTPVIAIGLGLTEVVIATQTARPSVVDADG